MENEQNLTPDISVPAADSAPDNYTGNVAGAFNQAFLQQTEPDQQEQQPAEPPAVMTQQQEKSADQQEQQPAESDDLPDFTLEDQLVTLEKLYSADELAQLAQTQPQQAWEYAVRANDYLHQNLQTITDIQAVAEKVGSVEALSTLGELGAAIFAPSENPEATIYGALLKLQEAYPDPENGPMSQIVRSVAQFRGPEVLTEMGDDLTTFLDGSHPYFQLATYQPQNDHERYQAQQYIDRLNQQRQALIERIAPTAYKHYGNDFNLREQYGLVGPEGEYYGLADNTIDRDIRGRLDESLRPVYDSLPPGLRAKLNNASLDEINDNLAQRKIAADAQAEVKRLREEQEENVRKFNERIESQQKEQAEARASAWENGVKKFVGDRLTGAYKLSEYPAQVIQMQLENFFKTDPQAKQVYERAKDAAKAGNGPLLARIEGDLSRHAEKAIRQYLAQWQKATGQQIKKGALPAQQPKSNVVPLYSAPPSAMTNGVTGEFTGDVAGAFQEAFRQLAPYANQ